MRNVNLNILKFLESIDNFCLSLTNIGLEVRRQETGDSFFLPSPNSGAPCSPIPFKEDLVST
ncbi:MAG: hypothetical protein EWV50_03045 [Microcystis aeruginosa Ma_MB_F_20061100_S20]|uniref:Uncharacterized protein n=1 Tax=Microcystis aeruginosa Ma_MB_F_20061100_S20D TaxID=2486253 RepID=A0A552E8N3_MICAE|nr:MAG: hypothetical protein EWV78_22180 [Microcystis aeruginosa Ma_MB_F_20061100_S20D]TRU42502.1 MAG: hypothetical protein EWV50_03045 [Microcystis aeruginosa Ma_MB_F_20061100_S20]